MFLCGPGSMIKDARNALFELGLPRERVHHEFFAPAAARFASGDTATPDAARGRGCRRQTGASRAREAIAILRWRPAPVRGAAGRPCGGRGAAAGIRVPYACKGGMCCTCRAKLVEGKAEMSDQLLAGALGDRARVHPHLPGGAEIATRLVVDYDQM